jgi:HTH-type transcriptional regulator/antitoxin HigA
MATKSNRLVPARAIHPGEILREELQERNIKQKDFAQQIGVQPTHLNEFIKGKRNLNEDLAMKLEKYLGIPFKTWMNLHNGYVYESKAIDAKKNENRRAAEYEAACSQTFNLHILYKRLKLNQLPCTERVSRIKEMFSFDLLSSNELRLQVAGFYKHSEKVQIDEKNMLTWLILNNFETSKAKFDIAPYKEGNAQKAALEMAKMANARTASVDNIKRCLNDYGILYIEVEKIEKAPIDAYSTFVGTHPVITVTYRYNDLDKLVFDILHELCHIKKHLSDTQKAFIAIEGVEYSKDPREREANDFARQMLIPEATWKSILKIGCKSLDPYKIIRTIAKEAELRGISPSIAVSRYKYETNWYKTSSYRSPKIH